MTPSPTPTPTGTPTPTPSATPTPSPTATPTPSPTPPDPRPIIGPNLLTNTANAAIGTYSATVPLFYSDMQTLVERMGELRLGSQTPAEPPVADGKQIVAPPPAPAQATIATWARGFGGSQTIDNGISRVFDEDFGGFQIGLDRRFSLPEGDLYVGGFGGYLYASRDFHDGGDGSTQGLSLGVYGTWIEPHGWYVDAVLKYSQYWNSFRTRTLFGPAIYG